MCTPLGRADVHPFACNSKARRNIHKAILRNISGVSIARFNQHNIWHRVVVGEIGLKTLSSATLAVVCFRHLPAACERPLKGSNRNLLWYILS